VRNQYTTGATGDIPNVMLYLRKLKMKAEVDLKTMAPHIQDNLRSLGTYMQMTADCYGLMPVFIIKWLSALLEENQDAGG
jgi:hypothetical protein